jgi:hypothetical protein
MFESRLSTGRNLSRPVNICGSRGMECRGRGTPLPLHHLCRSLPAKIFRLDPTTGKRVFWLEITPVDPSGLLYGHIYISPDGQSYAYHFRRILTNLYVAQNLH